MKRQRFFPKARAAQVLWLRNWALKLEEHGPTLGVAALTVTDRALDARRTAHVLGEYNTTVRELGPAVSAFQQDQCYGPEAGVLALPTLTPPAVPVNAGPVKAGALNRIFALCQVIKNSGTYTEQLGLELGVLGDEDATEDPSAPEFTATAEAGAGCQCVRLIFQKGSATGVYIEEKRGTGTGAFLAVDTESPYLDQRPLLVPGQPEVRWYRMRYYGDAQPTGEWTDWKAVTVSP